MKTIKLLFLNLFIAISSYAQVAINTNGNNADASAMLDVTSISKGLLVPRMTILQRQAISNPATGLLVYQSDSTKGFYYNVGTPASPNWLQLSSTLISELKDADADTRVIVEKTSDEDQIRFDIAGSEKVIIDSNGNLGVGVLNPIKKLEVNGDVKTSGTVWVDGANGSTPTSGAGTRMMWIPGKAALRAGEVSGNQWDDSEIGKYSVAFGYNAKAKGYCAIAMGCEPSALAHYSIAMGYKCYASGFEAVSIGIDCISSKDNSLSMGSYTRASAIYSISLGTQAKSEGNYSIAIGSFIKANSFGEIVLGSNNTDYQQNSKTSWDSNDRLFVIGNGINSNFKSDALVVLKNGNTGMGISDPNVKLDINGAFRMHFGSNKWEFNYDDNDNFFYIDEYGVGRHLKIFKDGALVLTGTGFTPVAGVGNRLMWIPGEAAFRAGRVTGADWDSVNIGFASVAMGYNPKASGDYSSAIGAGVEAASYGEVAMGTFSTSYIPNSTTSWNSSDRLFVIGNGTASSARSDALVLLKNGNLGLGFSNPTHRLEVDGSVKIGAYVLPAVDGTNGQVLKTNGSGVLSWTTDITNSTAGWTVTSSDVYRSSGKVGIGTSTPSNMLHINGGMLRITTSTNDKIIFDGTNTNPHTFLDATSKGFCFKDATNGELMVIKSTGKIGIGTSTPSNMLHINGGSLRITSSANDKIIFDGTNTSPHTFLDAASKGFRFWDATNGETMVITSAGNIGIGTSTPTCPLEINGFASVNGGTYGFLNSSGITGTGTGSNNYSIKVSHRIMASEFNAVSDQRVKTSFTLSNNSTDLQKVNQLEVTNYRYIDTVAKGSDMRLGFIAQQVEQIFPQAVNRSSNYIPSIYQVTENVKFNTDSNTQIISIATKHNLKKGDMLRLYDNNQSYEREIIEVISETSFKIKAVTKNSQQLFVFGKKVNDFRSVDYDRIFVLGISAIQELSAELELIKKQNNQLKAENKQLKTNDKKIEARLQRLEAIFEDENSTVNR